MMLFSKKRREGDGGGGGNTLNTDIYQDQYDNLFMQGNRKNIFDFLLLKLFFTISTKGTSVCFPGVGNLSNRESTH